MSSFPNPETTKREASSALPELHAQRVEPSRVVLVETAPPSTQAPMTWSWGAPLSVNSSSISPVFLSAVEGASAVPSSPVVATMRRDHKIEAITQQQQMGETPENTVRTTVYREETVEHLDPGSAFEQDFDLDAVLSTMTHSASPTRDDFLPEEAAAIAASFAVMRDARCDTAAIEPTLADAAIVDWLRSIPEASSPSYTTGY